MASILSIISTFSPLLPFVTGLLLFKKLDVNSRLVLLLTFLAAVSQINGYYNAGYRWTVFNLYIVADSALWSFVFYQNSRSKRFRTTILLVFLVQTIAFFVVIGQRGLGREFHSEFVCLNSFLQLFWVLAFFFERYRSEDVYALDKEPMFWFCLGILVYAPNTYFLFVYYDIVRAVSIPEYAGLWSLHDLLNTFMYLLFAVGIFVNYALASSHRQAASPPVWQSRYRKKV